MTRDMFLSIPKIDLKNTHSEKIFLFKIRATEVTKQPKLFSEAIGAKFELKKPSKKVLGSNLFPTGLELTPYRDRYGTV